MQLVVGADTDVSQPPLPTPVLPRPYIYYHVACAPQVQSMKPVDMRSNASIISIIIGLVAPQPPTRMSYVVHIGAATYVWAALLRAAHHPTMASQQ